MYLGDDFSYSTLKKKKIWYSRNLGGPSGEDSWLLARFQLNQILLILMKCDVSPSPPRPSCTARAAWLTWWHDSGGGNSSGLCEFTSCGGTGKTHSGNIPAIFLLINACRLEGSLGLLQTLKALALQVLPRPLLINYLRSKPFQQYFMALCLLPLPLRPVLWHDLQLRLIICASTSHISSYSACSVRTGTTWFTQKYLGPGIQ